MNADEFVAKCFDAGVAVLPGACFGGDDKHIRLSYALPDEDIIEGLKRIRRACEGG
jgi:aspartate/methionine/tyrosine aminotransferase